jgi:uncharacterized protein (TIGR00369 family)
MNNNEIVEFLNHQWPPAVKTLRGIAISYHLEDRSLRMDFEADPNFCHSGDIVQGGYITGMLDAVMAFSAIGHPQLCDWVATLEIKVNFIAPGRNGKFSAIGSVVHGGQSIGYLEGKLYQQERLIATATSTVKFLTGSR